MPRYKLVAGWPGYRVGTDGSVWTRWKKGPEGLFREWRRHYTFIDRDGYHRVCLAHKGKKQSRGLHQLILEAFRGPCPPGKEARHKNNMPGDNRLRNLQWATKKVNQGDRVANGTHMRGEKHPLAKISDAQARAIRKDYATGKYTQRGLARIHGVTQCPIARIVRGEGFRHLLRRPKHGKPD